MTYYSFAFGIGSKDSAGNWLEVFYPEPLLYPAADLLEKITQTLGHEGGNGFLELGRQQLETLQHAFPASSDSDSRIAALLQTLMQSTKPLLATFLASDSQPASVPEAYLKLHLLSHRLVKPHATNLNGIFALLPNVAWTNQGAIAVSELAGRQLQARLQGEFLEVMSVDKFPKMANYVVPSGVRIAHTARVRLGAYIGEGTTVMHEGFVNFNAGTDGKAMIEGRISAGVTIGEGSDLGGGCSTMGTLSGGGNELISVGRDCLIGANAGLGFPLGDRCIIEAGLYVTAGTKVSLLDHDNKPVAVVRARELSGRNDLLFRRNSNTGMVECKTNKSKIELNAELHAHN
ncbi:MAG: 2,3,4,5-tetrahydropyridine-2,6-dicarboxylate N-succinyltransferase [Pseudomonadales bacterium]|nr:2,3,4,5-tetrahydropyridine-2,6-dicarboxylate N-succinyltransferase [Pseudomonadales bacterium]